ncbi:SDR family NAD(P)-dependent oxidoreductase [Henriciella algicola]|uniref:SDR family NAD(P)-dependent oxidoreductase n=1 Tax=Henriciella algicola TaxID=1608422 RepID=A0A399RI09_9PROT|nr:SDR family NAD(P)-dependent oxidoreductase [Henriciella algicola]RIJ29627.1 SDR family NAD(P)-dependent oxidoreductase [Henriciella algicola]
MNIIITGASSGIGQATLRRLGKTHTIGAVARRGERLETLADEYPRIIPLVADVSDREQVEHIVRQFEQKAGPVDVLVNNAGLALGADPAFDADPDDWFRMIDVNCKGLVQMTHPVLSSMVRRHQGLIVNIGSVAASYPYRGGNVYGATKAFIRQFSRNLRSDIHGTGVRVCVIEPGSVSGSEFSLVRFHGDQDKADSVYDGWDPLQADDIAAQIEWVISLPQRVNVNLIETMATGQSASGFQFARE